MFDVRCLMFEGNPASPRLRRDTNTALRRRKKRGRGQHSSKKLVELVMRTDPCPLNCVTGPFADSANVPAHSHRPIVRVAAQLFEFKGWMIGIDSRSPDRSVASPCDQCSPPGRVPAHRVFLEQSR